MRFVNAISERSRSVATWWLFVALAFAGVSPSGAQSVIAVDTIVASGFSRPVYVTHAGDGTGRLFVVEQSGRILIVDSGAVLPTPFLDIINLVSSNGEQGLLSVAFHPSYPTNGLFYLNYTNTNGDTVIARYAVSADPNVANLGSAMILLTIAQPFGNHNGGQLQFSPIDGFLYIAMGDGGGGNDPENNGQNINTLNGSMLRIDIDSGSPYAIPPDNPFVGAPGADEIWAYGLRNPWRFSFDRQTGDLFIGDVGQGTWEEIDFQEAGSMGGLNFGWVIREGPCPNGQVMPCAPAPPQFTDPIASYGRTEGSSVTGGYIYHGVQHPSLEGRYFYGDFSTGRIWSVHATGSAPITWSTPRLELSSGFNISSFGEDEAGELYVVDYFGGAIRSMRALDSPLVSSPLEGAQLSGTTHVFEWDASQTPVTEWWIYAGSSVGGAEYYDSDTLGAATTTTVTGLPTDGSPIQLRLWYRVHGLWRFSDFQYTAANIIPTPPELTAPVPLSTLSGNSEMFRWVDNATPATEWWLYVGSTMGGNDHFNSGTLGMSREVVVSTLPTDGSLVHVRLWYRVSGAWLFRDFQYTAATIVVPTPEITTPMPGGTLVGASATFQWIDNTLPVAEWWLYVGSSVGGNDHFNSGSLGANLQVAVDSLPVDGSTVHVRLWFLVAGVWQSEDFQYTAALAQPAIVSPTPGSTLAGSMVAMTWAANGVAVAEWWLYVGSAPASADYFDSGSLGAQLQATVVGLPTDGSQIFVRLWFRVAGLWQFVDFQYTAA